MNTTPLTRRLMHCVMATAVLVASHAIAVEDWQVLQQGSAGSFAFSPTSVQRSGSTVRVWARFAFAAPRTTAFGTFDELRLQVVFDCTLRAGTALSMFWYLDGALAGRNEEPQTPMPVKPGSDMDTLMSALCRPS